MRKIIILLSVFMLVGCSNTLSSQLSIDTAIQAVLSEENAKSNTQGIGFKYYKPRDFTILEDNKYNQILLNNGNKYYLNIDINGYYSKYKEDYIVNDSIYFSTKFYYDDKSGYVEVRKGNNSYFYIKMMYNYSYIEVGVNEANIKEAIINSAIILSSIRYNDNVISHLISTGGLDSKESAYEIKKPILDGDNKNVLFYEYDGTEDKEEN